MHKNTRLSVAFASTGSTSPRCRYWRAVRFRPAFSCCSSNPSRSLDKERLLILSERNSANQKGFHFCNNIFSLSTAYSAQFDLESKIGIGSNWYQKYSFCSAVGFQLRFPLGKLMNVKGILADICFTRFFDCCVAESFWLSISMKNILSLNESRLGRTFRLDWML